MAITQALCNSFKQELLEGTHDLDNDTLKIALYTSSATLSAATTAYSATDEASGPGYSAGGVTITGAVVTLDSGTAVFDADNPSWSSASFSAAGALIYNSTQSNKAIAVLDFGGTFTVSSGTFEVVFPAAAAATGLIRLA